MSFTAKPCAPAGKTASLPRFKNEGNLEKGKSQTMPGAIPSLSGDVLKQRLAAMHGKKPQVPQKKEQFINPGVVAAPIISENQLKVRRESMNRPPAPSTPDAKQKYDKTPEFLRKKLKPTSLTSNDTQEKKDDIDNKSKECSDVEEEKKSFRNSRLLFEKISAAPKVTPKPAPKPMPRPKNSVNRKAEEASQDNATASDGINGKDGNACQSNEKVNSLVNDLVEEKPEVGQSDRAEMITEDLRQVEEIEDANDQLDVTEKSKEALNQLDNILNLEGKNEDANEETIEKPNIELPDVPVGLNLWMKHFVKNNAKLSKFDDLDAVDAPAPVHAEFRSHLPSRVEPRNDSSQDANDDIYDDVAQNAGVSGLVQDTSAAASDEIYDDVVMEAAHTTGPPGPIQDDTYDDVKTTSQQLTNQEGQVCDELYDDVNNQMENNQDFYDDVSNATNGGFPSHEAEEEDSGEPADEALYEPVETIAQYVTQGNIARLSEEKAEKPLRSDNSVDKGNKKREEKERKEREKLEKKKREDAERRRKKDEEEKKKRDKEERERIKKERKLFNLRLDEDPLPIERHMAEVDVKGKGKDLSITRGEYLDVISINNCPKGKVLVQNSFGKLGYVLLKDIGMDKRKSLFMATSPVALGVAFGGVEEQFDGIRGISTSAVSSEIVSLSSTSANGSFAPSFGQPRSAFQLGQSAPTATSNEDEEGGGFYEQI